MAKAYGFACALVALALALSLIGCGGEDTVAPEGTNDFPSTPGKALTALEQALSDMDYASFDGLIHQNFQFLIQDADINQLDLGTDRMSRREYLSSVSAILTERNLVVDRTSSPGIEAIEIGRWEPVTEWAPVSSGHPDFPNTVMSRYEVDLWLTVTGADSIHVRGQQDFYVAVVDSTTSDGLSRLAYRIIGQEDLTLTNRSSAPMTWGALAISFLANVAPVASFTVTPEEVQAGEPVLFDASASYDPDNSSGGLRYRWEAGAQSTSWLTSPQIEFLLSDAGEVSVELTVRDAWNEAGSDSRTVRVLETYPFPDTPDKLMSNFKKAYGEMFMNEYRNTLHSDFKFFYQQADIDNLGLGSDHHNQDEELQISDHIFSGNPSPSSGEAGVSSIDFNFLEAATTWEDSFNPDFPGARRALFQIILFFERPASTTIEVQGNQEFYVIARDSVQDDATIKDYFQLVGQVDLSDLGKPVEGCTWGRVKALYR